MGPTSAAAWPLLPDADACGKSSRKQPCIGLDDGRATLRGAGTAEARMESATDDLLATLLNKAPPMTALQISTRSTLSVQEFERETLEERSEAGGGVVGFWASASGFLSDAYNLTPEPTDGDRGAAANGEGSSLAGQAAAMLPSRSMLALLPPPGSPGLFSRAAGCRAALLEPTLRRSLLP